MCGIVGFTRQITHVEDGVIRAMTDAIIHRGPDGEGHYLGSNTVLGMRRLSIIDLDGGQQPMKSADGRFVLVYNGELYDYQKHRERLIQEGYVFNTTCDSEVVLRLWEAEGRDCISRLNGMFGFAVCDLREDRLYLVRDHMGIKPLYYSHIGSELVFASELTAITCYPGFSARLNHQALAGLLVDKYVSEPDTLFEGVCALEPGCCLEFHRGTLSIHRYFDLGIQGQDTYPVEGLQSRVTSTFDESVRSQLVADVPVGAFLSGGIDSSTVCAVARKYVGGEFHTFSFGFDSKSYDESAMAKSVSLHLGTIHHELRLTEHAIGPEFMDLVLARVGQPLGDSSSIPLYLLSQEAKKHVKVALSGDGADEFWGGYRNVQLAPMILDYQRRMPAFAKNFLAATLTIVKDWPISGDWGRRAYMFNDMAHYNYPDILRYLRALWVDQDLAEVLVSPVELKPASIRGQSGREDPRDLALTYYATNSMVSGILRKVDAMSMAASLEVRVPFLDRRMAELACHVAAREKFSADGTAKHLVRGIGRGTLPSSLYEAPKTGFRVPFQDYFSEDFWGTAEDLLSPGSDIAQLIRTSALNECITMARDPESFRGQGSVDRITNRLWLLVQIAQWMSRFKVTL